MAGGKKGKKKGAAKKQPRSSFGRVAFAISLVAVIVVVSGILVTKYLPPAVATRKHASLQKSDAAVIPPQYEVFEKHPVPERPARPVAPVSHKPKLTLIIDDIGYRKRVALDLMALDPAIALAILPGSPHGKSIARAARKNGVELMLHQPMEPNEYPKVDPGPGALIATMDPDRLIGILKKNLNAIDGIKGVNNHMGSKLTSLSPQMYQVMTLLKKEGLYFIDSRTSAETVGRSAARLMQVPFAERDVFLDHVQTREEVARQVEKMLLVAEKHGSAVGIGHPHDVTYEVLHEMMPEIHRRVTLVRPSVLVALP